MFMFLFSALSNGCSPLKWQISKKREFGSSFVVTMRNQFIRLIMLENVLCDDATNGTQASEWYSHFKNRQTSIKDFEWSGRPFLCQTEKWG
jgi:hypothetical protein